MDKHLTVSASRRLSEAMSSSLSKKLSSGRFASEEVDLDRRKYPIGAEDYELLEEIGQGVSASVYRARCVPLNEIVAIKILDFERNNSDLGNISREAQTMILVDHPNVLRAHCSFVKDHNLWVVMPFLAGGSCLHILKAAYPDGFEEVVIATILREVLKGLEYLHHHGHIHRDVKAGNILIDARGAIKLGDFGVSACLFDSGDRQRSRNTFVGTPCWMAPEVMEQLHGYDFKADIWSFGITALELAHGHAPFSKYPPMKVLLMTLQNAPPGLDYERDRKFSKSFKQMIAMCLVKDPSKRPTAQKLLKHSFFKKARSNDYIARALLEGLPNLGDRLRALKLKEADMLAQKKMPDGKKEELSQSEYKRGISGWNFNIEDMKTQASLIQDDEAVPDKEQGGSSSSLSGLDSPSKYSQSSSVVSLKDYGMEKEDEDRTRTKPTASQSRVPSSSNNLKENCNGAEDDFSVVISNRKPCSGNGMENGLNERCEESNDKHRDGTAPHADVERALPNNPSHTTAELGPSSCKGERDKQQSQIQATGTCDGVEDAPLDMLPKAPRSSGTSNSDHDEKSKGPVVQQRGRFKVTSENVELEKVVLSSLPAPAPILQKSHSMQVISQLPAVYTSLPPDATTSTSFGSSIYTHLHTILQTNILLRDHILNAMKHISSSQGTNVDFQEKSLLEAAHERERELLLEITDLQGRLINAQDEINRLKSENRSS
ncbi:serine/threonine-protein kinase BLUS1-like [Aristolochia californica]|uniref:serine/threonine-protein kinase BLUS1-like n=1 Tax=Aristolochia californica TaxID=171875 RepID=UPI0035E28179